MGAGEGAGRERREGRGRLGLRQGFQPSRQAFVGLWVSVDVAPSCVQAALCPRAHVCTVPLSVCMLASAPLILSVCPSRPSLPAALCSARRLTLGAHRRDSCLSSSWVWPMQGPARRSEGEMDRLGSPLRSYGSHQFPQLLLHLSLQAQGWHPGSMLLLASPWMVYSCLLASLHPALTFVNGPLLTFSHLV